MFTMSKDEPQINVLSYLVSYTLQVASKCAHMLSYHAGYQFFLSFSCKLNLKTEDRISLIQQ